MALHSPSLNRHAGFVLLEALLAVLIFSIGILALVGMQAVSVKQSTDAKYRSEAGLLADQLLGTMWVSDRTTATLQANFDSTGTGAAAARIPYSTWVGTVKATLPGVVDNSPTAPVVVVGVDGTVTITVSWRMPSDPVTAPPHKHVAIAKII